MRGPISAGSLVRNDRVFLDPSDTPHLVDSVREGEGPTVRVVFSSGEERVFMVDDDVLIID